MSYYIILVLHGPWFRLLSRVYLRREILLAYRYIFFFHVHNVRGKVRAMGDMHCTALEMRAMGDMRTGLENESNGRYALHSIGNESNGRDALEMRAMGEMHCTALEEYSI